VTSRHPPPPRWLSVCDGATAILALLTIVLALTGGFRIVLSESPITLKWTHAGFAALAIAVLRHLAAPAPSFVESIRRWKEFVVSRPALADAILAFLLTRPAVLLVGLLAVVTFGFPSSLSESAAGRQLTSALPSRWDANWYAGIAAGGYDWERQFHSQQNLAFFPAYPVLIRVVATLTGAFQSGLPPDRLLVRLTWCGLVVSLAAFLWAAWYFARLAREMLDDERARMATVLLASYPFAVFYSAPYSEPLFLLAALGAWFHFRRDELGKAAVWGLVAGLARSPGCFLSVPLGLLAIGFKDAPARNAVPASSFSVKRLLVAATPGIGMLLFTVYLYQRTGIWFAWARMHEAWGRVIGGSSPFGTAPLASRGLFDLIAANPYQSINAAALVFALVMVVPVWRRLGIAWAAYVLLSVLMPFFAGGVLSMGRFTSTLFPVFLALAALVPHRTAPALAALFGVLQGLMAALFFTWRDVF
jgi:Gpi18-like mannosyltransferase